MRSFLGLVLLVVAVWLYCFFSFPLRAQQSCPAPPAFALAAGKSIFTPQQEVDLGDIEAEQLEKSFRVIHDDELTSYMNGVVTRLLAHMPPTQLNFRVVLIDMPVVNSFSIAGGRIYVTRKMVAFLRNEDELAGLLGHEMGHVLTHQYAIEMTRRFQEILGVTSVGDRKDIFDKYNRLLDNLAKNTKILRQGAREEEPRQYQADQAAFYAGVSAGYSPESFVDFFDRLAQTNGKTGNVLTDLFQTTTPDEKRLRLMRKFLEDIPAACRGGASLPPSPDFQKWRTEVIAYNGLGHDEVLTGVLDKKKLDPPLRSDIARLKFSPNGQYVLAQDDSSVFVLSHDPFKLLFRFDAPDAHSAQFTPDSQHIVFDTRGMRVEEWNVNDEQRTLVHEVLVPEGCIQTLLAPDGKTLACLTNHLDLKLVNVDSDSVAFTKKEFFIARSFRDYLEIYLTRYIEAGTLAFINMGFSPDARYFVAAHGTTALAIDLNSHAPVAMHGTLADMLGAGFVFLGSDRIIARNGFDPKNSALMEFPSGKVIERLPIGRQSMEAPAHGDYVILRPVKDARVGLMDLQSQNILIGLKKTSALDIYDQHLLAETASGEIGLFENSTHKQEGRVSIPLSPLGGLRASALSPDLKWLALSGTTRGAVWDLSTAKRTFYARGFRGAYFEGDRTLYADFPKEEPVDRNIARFDLASNNAVPGFSVGEDSAAQQDGPYLIRRKSAGKENSLFRNITIELCDVRDGHSLWSRNFPEETPVLTLDPDVTTLLAEWPVDDKAAKDEIKSSPALQRRFAAMQNHQGAYLLQAFKADSGEVLGQILVDTGKGSFRITRAYAAGDWVVAADSDNRTRLYSLSNGEEKGTFFGTQSQLSLAAATLAIQNEAGQLDVYSLPSLEKRTQLVFPSRISLQRFSADGKRLFVLTSNQTAYILDVAALGHGLAKIPSPNSNSTSETAAAAEIKTKNANLTPRF
jgi:Peptidase family M48